MSGASNSASGVWIFGYGSLVWRPSFPHLERGPGFIRGWVRRFWQGSTDHRGVPSAPGRVVTLIASPADRCWGVAYRVAGEARQEVLAALDHRERGGFDRHRVRVEFADSGRPPAEALVYVAGSRNPNFLGPASDVEIAAQIRGSRGPSGPNLEYALRLAESLAEIGAEDDHVFAIADLLREEER